MIKKIILIVSVFSFFLIHGQEADNTFNLNNLAGNSKREPSKERGEELDKLNINNKKVLPKSFYIGDLTDVDSIEQVTYKDVLKSINGFIDSIVKGANIKNIDTDFTFIFQNRYSFFIDNGNKIENFNTGEVNNNSIDFSVNIEFIIEEEIYAGVIYTTNTKPYSIIDIQIEKKDKVIFDPTSYKNNLY